MAEENGVNKKLMVLVVLMIMVSLITGVIASSYFADQNAKKLNDKLDKIESKTTSNSPEYANLTKQMSVLSDQFNAFKKSYDTDPKSISSKDVQDMKRQMIWMTDALEKNNEETQKALNRIRSDINSIDVRPIVYVNPVY